MAMSTAELAEQLGTDTKSLRKFLRSHLPKDVQPGQGGRYSFDKAEVTKLTKAYTKWSEGKPEKVEGESKPKSSRSRKKKDEAPAEVIEELDDDDEPTDEDLEALEDLDESIDDIDDLLDEDEE